MAHRRVRMAASAGAAALAVLALSGCGPAPWQGESSASPTPTTSVSVAPPVSNDLSSGSTERELTAGAVTATVNYWSELSMDRWTANAVKPISLSLVTEITPDDGQKVYLQKATMVAVPGNADETFAALDPQTDAATVTPGYLVLDPYSYSQTFNVGAVPAEATFVTVQFTYDFLVQTAPKSKEYAKQTATDTLTIAIAQG
ncbi:hypothetical protein ACFQRL_00870 [Microbacterium fluvii]|uniref:Uncharacterized protein n=1 Tax=Microbacterium fluvii TaxID=415215 RepID=A0ABW2HAP9_9MICO|nr:hypothetical protein [Microbacterium fluvii]MCU4671138.1 hypothetical protein [Microbacterium fluvii]